VVDVKALVEEKRGNERSVAQLDLNPSIVVASTRLKWQHAGRAA
jgi:hypothetical protein